MRRERDSGLHSGLPALPHPPGGLENMFHSGPPRNRIRFVERDSAPYWGRKWTRQVCLLSPARSRKRPTKRRHPRFPGCNCSRCKCDSQRENPHRWGIFPARALDEERHVPSVPAPRTFRRCASVSPDHRASFIPPSNATRELAAQSRAVCTP